jgi:rRNA maturation protein Rpf1
MNKLVEHANGMILQGIKPRIFNRLNKFGGRWVAELLAELWSLRTTPSQAIGYTPFSKIYNAEVILLTDLDNKALRVMQYREPEAKEYLEDALDQPDERPRSLSTSKHCVNTIAVRSRGKPSMSSHTQ